MAQPAIQVTKAEDYTKIYWVEAFSEIMEKPQLEKEKFYFFSRVLISHTLGTNVLKDSQLSDPDYQTKLIDTFYETYKETKSEERNALLTTVFMKTLIDIDPNRMKLKTIDLDYIENIALESALKAKNFTHLLDDKNKRAWLLTYMYAKTSPQVIEYNVKLYESLGKENYDLVVKKELCISSGPQSVPPGTSDFFSEGWYTLYGKSKFSLEKVINLKSVMEDPSKLSQDIDPMIGLIYFKYRLVQQTLPLSFQATYWSAKVSNISTFIKQVSQTDQLATKN